MRILEIIDQPDYELLDKKCRNFEEGLNYCGYFSVSALFSGNLRQIFGVAQVVSSLSLALIHSLSALNALRKRDKIDIERLRRQIDFDCVYSLHGVANIFRGVFEATSGFAFLGLISIGSPVLFLYDRWVGRIPSFETFYYPSGYLSEHDGFKYADHLLPRQA